MKKNLNKYSMFEIIMKSVTIQSQRRKLASQVQQHYSRRQMESQVSQKVKTFFSAYPLQKFNEGKTVIHAGENPTHIYYIESGTVKQHDISYRGEEIIVNVYKKGAFFPLVWAITRLPNRYFFTTDSSVSFRRAPYKEVLRFIKDNPDVLYDLLERLYKGLDGVLGRMVQLMTGTAKNRVLYEILVEARRFGDAEDDGSYRISLTEAELASRVGVSRETVSRQLQKAAANGSVVLQQRSIIIPDIHSLETQLIEEI